MDDPVSGNSLFLIADGVDIFQRAFHTAGAVCVHTPDKGNHLPGGSLQSRLDTELTCRYGLALICRKRNLYQVKTVCELRALSQAGYMPDLVACQSCGSV